MSMQVVLQVDPVTTPVNFVIGVGSEPNNMFPDGTTDADFGDGYHLVTLADDTQIEVIAENQWCYLSADGLSLYGGDEPA